MAGIYVHIPYCKQACYYCDFHFSTNTQTKEELIDAILLEVELRRGFIQEPVETLYFGGGTPTLLSASEIKVIVDQIEKHFDLSALREFTFEANPDDLSVQKLTDLKHLGVDRLSIGIQSFNDKFLQYFNRAHDARMAFECLKQAKKIGFDNLSIDLIFGIPDQTIEELRQDLEIAIDLQTQHISIYGLTIEQNTVFGRWYDKGKLNPLDEDRAGEQLQTIMCELTANGFEQYEISNFCKAGFEAKHNSSYWQGKNYLGLGPAAHTYNGHTRQFSVRNNSKFIKSIRAGVLPIETEQLSLSDQINEFILTRLRTSTGISTSDFKRLFNENFHQTRHSQIQELIALGKIVQFDDRICLTDDGKLIADHITEQLMV